MRDIITILILLTIISGRGYSQSWELLMPDWDAVRIVELLETTDSGIYATGSNSTLLKSDDGGNTWKDLRLPLEYMNLYSIDWDGRYIFISGESFDFQLFPATTTSDSLLRLFRYDIQEHSLMDISIKREKPENYSTYPLIRPPLVSCSGKFVFVSEQRSGNYPCVLRKSSDQGISWQEIDVPEELWAFEAVNDDVLVSVSSTAGFDTIRIHRSANGGESWDLTYTMLRETLVDKIPLSVNGETDSAMIAIGLGPYMLLSEDAGISWRKTDDILWNSHSHGLINALDINPLGSIIAVGYESDTYESTDKGDNWLHIKEASYSQSFGARAATSVSMNQSGLINISNEEGHFYHSEDAGLTWQTIRMNDIREISGIHFFDNAHGFLRAWDYQNAIAQYTTSDGGGTWRRCGSLPDDFTEIIASISSESVLYGYGRKVAGDSTLVTIYVSTDLGDKWNVLAANSFPDKYGLSDLFAASGVLLINSPSVSEEPRIWSSIDSGQSWTSAPITGVGSNYGLEFASIQDASGAIIIYRYDRNARNAGISNSIDSGRTWLDSGFFPDSSYYGIQEFQTQSPNTLFCRVIWRDYATRQNTYYEYLSDNGGQTWQQISETNPYQVNAILPYIAPTYFGGVLYSSYGALQMTRKTAPWTKEELMIWKQYSGSVSRKFFLDNDNIWLTSGQTIYRTSTGGVDWVQQPFTVREGAAITSIYPNPVSTQGAATVEYMLPATANISLTLYSALGQEVRREEKRMEPGAHTERINTAGLAPGIYYYTLLAGSHRETKMVVVK